MKSALVKILNELGGRYWLENGYERIYFKNKAAIRAAGGTAQYVSKYRVTIYDLPGVDDIPYGQEECTLWYDISTDSVIAEADAPGVAEALEHGFAKYLRQLQADLSADRAF